MTLTPKCGQQSSLSTNGPFRSCRDFFQQNKTTTVPHEPKTTSYLWVKRLHPNSLIARALTLVILQFLDWDYIAVYGTELVLSNIAPMQFHSWYAHNFLSSPDAFESGLSSLALSSFRSPVGYLPIYSSYPQQYRIQFQKYHFLISSKLLFKYIAENERTKSPFKAKSQNSSSS